MRQFPRGAIVRHRATGLSYVVLDSAERPIVARVSDDEPRRVQSGPMTDPAAWAVLTVPAALVPMHESMGAVLDRTRAAEEGD